MIAEAQPIKWTFQETIKAHRESRGLSLRKVASSVDVTFTTIEQWEKGKHEPKLSNIVALAKLYDLSLDAIFNLGDYKNAETKSDNF